MNHICGWIALVTNRLQFCGIGAKYNALSLAVNEMISMGVSIFVSGIVGAHGCAPD
jgi:hypothetical protein